jgi:hypothetical protein
MAYRGSAVWTAPTRLARNTEATSGGWGGSASRQTEFCGGKSCWNSLATKRHEKSQKQSTEGDGSFFGRFRASSWQSFRKLHFTMSESILSELWADKRSVTV